ncbi:MAG: hypothetical protein Q9174_002648 [Haloplaca sp. 1 TL-2023]
MDVDINDIDIRANEIVGGKSGRMNRYFEEAGRRGEGGLWTSGDKRAVMDEVVVEGERGMVVYVGDSVTDLECLIGADVGICVRDVDEDGEGMGSEQRGLEETLGRLGITCSWIGEMCATDVEEAATREGKGKQEASLWWARNFDEICNCPLFNDSIIESGINKTVDVESNDTYSTADPNATLSTFSTDAPIHTPLASASSSKPKRGI